MLFALDHLLSPQLVEVFGPAVPRPPAKQARVKSND